MFADPIPISPQVLEVDFRIPADGTPTLVCRGRMTSETSDLLTAEVKKLAPHNKLIIVDLSRVRYMDSSDLGTLLATYISAKTAGCSLRLVNLNSASGICCDSLASPPFSKAMVSIGS